VKVVATRLSVHGKNKHIIRDIVDDEGELIRSERWQMAPGYGTKIGILVSVDFPTGNEFAP